MTSNSEPKRGSEDRERLEEFIRQFDDRGIELRPDPASDQQIRLADELAQLMTLYKRKEGCSPTMVYALEHTIRAVKAQGMVRPGSELPKKLKQCQEELKECREDNRNLSLQLLEYKNKLGLTS